VPAARDRWHRNGNQGDQDGRSPSCRRRGGHRDDPGSDMSYLFPLEGCEPRLAEVVGGKAVGLGWLMREELRVPPGFGVGRHAYRECVTDTGLDRTIHDLLKDAGSVDEQAEVSRRIRSLFDEHEAGSALREELAQAYERLGVDRPVAVRSSAISED